MTTKFISKKKAALLEESIGFLSDYTPYTDKNLIIGDSLVEPDEELTEMLHELGKINLRRAEILAVFNKFKGE